MKKLFYIVFIFSALHLGVTANAQESTEKKPLFVYIGYYQSNNQLPKLKISTKTKNGRKFEIAEGITVNVFLNEESPDGFLGQVTTNLWGEAWVPVSSKFKPAIDNSPTLNFVATATNNKGFEDTSTELEISKAKIQLELKEEDSVRTISATLLALEDSVWMPVPEAEIKLIAKRMLKDLPVGEDESYETDEEGSVSSEYTMQLPGDETGKLILGAKIVDNDSYGTIEATQEVNWGVPLKKDDSFLKRTLWSTRDKTPWWLLIFPNLIITGVWGVIYYLIYVLIRIRNMGKLTENT